VEKLIGTHLRRNDVTLNFTPGENIPACSLIQDQIKQVILNISLNAVESMPKGGTLSITTHLEKDENQVRLEISDTGAGIPQDVLPYIFDPFVTTKDRGTGLGLAITYDIVSRHGGRIEPESQPGQGTTFHVWLPVEM
jgi:two-component system sensor histidine kinase AtoS